MYRKRRKIMNTQFRKGIIEMCVLALIAKKDMYGYEIVQSIAEYTDINEGRCILFCEGLQKKNILLRILKKAL